MKDIICGESYRRVRHVQCLFCGGESPVHVLDVAYGMKASIAHCPNCNFEYQTPQPSERATEAYMDWRWDKGKDKYVVSPWWQLKNAGDHLELIEPTINKDMKILDFGAGAGAFVATARQKGYDIVGCDQSSGARRAAERLHKTVIESSMPTGRFDCITMWDVVEHLKDPEKTLRWLGRHLNPGGLLIMETGNWEHCNGPGWGLYMFDHQYYYTPYSLEQLTSGLGFSDYKILSEDRVFVAVCKRMWK